MNARSASPAEKELPIIYGMDMLTAVLQPINDMGPDVSAAIYKMPASVKPELIGGVIAQRPRLGELMRSGRAKVNAASSPGGEGMLAIGGFIEPEELREIHIFVMSIGGMEFVVGCGPGAALLPRTAIGEAAVGAHARAMAERKPKWKFWK